MDCSTQRNWSDSYEVSSLGTPDLVWQSKNFHISSDSRLAPKQDIQEHLPLAKAVFLDRDGVIIEDTGYLNDPGAVRLLPRVGEAIKKLQQQFLIIVITNQSGVARGMFSEKDLFWIHDRMVRELRLDEAIIDGLYYCPHLPEAKVPRYGCVCDCRKPGPGMLKRASIEWNIDVSNSYMIGDNQRDVEAGIAAGIRSILIGEYSNMKNALDFRCANLYQAAQYILSKDGS